MAFVGTFDTLWTIHILAIAIALGCTIVADGVAIFWVFTTRAAAPGRWLEWLHLTAIAGLVVVLSSSILLFAPGFADATSGASDGTAFAIFSVVGINAVFVGGFVPDMLRSAKPRRIAHVRLHRLLALALGLSVSWAGWGLGLAASGIAGPMIARMAGLSALPALVLPCWLGLAGAGVVASAIARRERRGDAPTAHSTLASTAGSAYRVHPIPRVGNALNDRKPARPAPVAGPGGNAAGGPTVADAISACRGALWGVGQISIVTNLLMLAGPLFMLQVYDRVLSSGSVPTLAALLAIVASVFGLVAVLEVIRSRILIRAGVRLDRVLRDVVFARIGESASMKPGQRRAFLLRDLERLRQFASGTGALALFDLPLAPLYFLVIFLLHWVLGFVAVGGAVLLIGIAVAGHFLSRSSITHAAKTFDTGLALADAGERNAQSMRAMGMLDPYRSRWRRVHDAAVAYQARASDKCGEFYVLTKVIRLFLQSLILAGGAYYAIAGEITAGMIVAVSIMMARALAPVEQLTGQWRGAVDARRSLRRISHEIAAIDQTGARTRLPEPEGVLNVEDVYAAPPGEREPVLMGISLMLDPGSVLGVIGSSGSGKSTLARVLVGVWPTKRGAVRLDGAPLDNWPIDQLGRHIGYLSQDIELFDGTVAENISRFEHDIDEDSLFAATRLAGVHDLILTLSKGYDTEIGRSGMMLSGGQRQRIALARALYGDPTLIVLDEPNSNLDQPGREALSSAISRLRDAGKTVVVITHEPGILDVATHILVLRHGRVASFGPKTDVVSRIHSIQRGR